MEITTQLIDAWMVTHGIKSRIKAMLDLKFYIDMYQKEKAPIAVEANNTQLTPSLTQSEVPYEDKAQMDTTTY